MAVLEYLTNAHVPKDVAAISADLGMNKSTTPRSLSTLVAPGHIRQDDETVRHCLGSNFRERHLVRLQQYSIDDMENKASVAPPRTCAITWDTLSPL